MGCRKFAILLLGLVLGCASQAKKTLPIEGKPPLANHVEWFTTLDPATASKTIAANVVQFGFKGEQSFFSSGPPKVKGDYFDSNISTVNDRGQAFNARAQWIKEGRTQIAIETALPKDRHNFVIAKLKDAISQQEKAGASR